MASTLNIIPAPTNQHFFASKALKSLFPIACFIVYFRCLVLFQSKVFYCFCISLLYGSLMNSFNTGSTDCSIDFSTPNLPQNGKCLWMRGIRSLSQYSRFSIPKIILFQNPEFWVIRDLMMKKYHEDICKITKCSGHLNCDALPITVAFCLKSCTLRDLPIKPWMKSHMTHTKSTAKCAHGSHWTIWKNERTEKKRKKERIAVIFGSLISVKSIVFE